MKNIVKTIFFVLLTMLIATSCDPQDKHDLGLGSEPTVNDLEFLVEVSADNPNIIQLTNKSSRKGVPVWDLGNNLNGKGDAVTAIYPYKGEYTISMTLYTTGGAATISKNITIAEDNLSLLDTKAYRYLTGGVASTDGKTWVLDQYNLFAEEVAKATKKEIKGHMGLGPFESYSQEWWGAAPNDKDKWTLYEHKFTFKQEGTLLHIENAGKGYGRAASTASVGGYPNITVKDDDAIFDFNGGDFTFSINEAGTYPILSLAKNAYMGYYCGSQDYEIIYQTEEVMALRVANTVENQDWTFVYCLEELNIEPPAPVIPVKPTNLSEDFEGSKPSVAFLGEDMGSKFSQSYQNPAPVPINESEKVCLYEKSGDSFYSNISYTAEGFKFDLTENNKVRFKVYVPSYNDYETEHEVAGEWITITKLQPQVSVKIQDSSKGGNAWETQVEVVKTDLAKDKWIELEFDFSSAKDNETFDRIVIQFGAEGHKAPGIFFFDDFTFSN